MPQHCSNSACIDIPPFWFHYDGNVNVTIKDLPARIHRKLKRRAGANKRSLNREVIDILEQAVQSTPLDVEATLAEFARLRGRIQGPALTEAMLREAKNQG